MPQIGEPYPRQVSATSARRKAKGRPLPLSREELVEHGVGVVLGVAVVLGGVEILSRAARVVPRVDELARHRFDAVPITRI